MISLEEGLHISGTTKKFLPVKIQVREDLLTFQEIKKNCGFPGFPVLRILRLHREIDEGFTARTLR